jgi:hypothetical protein
VVNAKRFVRLTCKCGMEYTLAKNEDAWRRCIKCRALPMDTTDPSERGRYVTSLQTLMDVLKQGKPYKEELADAKAMTDEVCSPYQISIEGVTRSGL